MKLKLFLGIFGVLALNGCGPEVIFTEPMPPNEKNLNAFPWKYRGDYVNNDGSTYLHIDKQMITKEYDYDVRIHRDSMTYFDSLAGDTLWDNYTRNYRFVTVDSAGYVCYHVNETEHVFGINADFIARKYKGYLFLNSPYDAGWTCEQVKLKKGILTISSISTVEAVEALNECVEDHSDTVALSYSPTKKQFKSFVKSDGFGYGEEYHRIK